MRDDDDLPDGFVLVAGPAPRDEEDRLLDAAFGLTRRVKASYRLREGSAPVKGLVFHARDARKGRLAGVLSFWPLRVYPGGAEALLLGPLAVHPDFQNGGLGSVLMRRGLQAASDAGHGLVLLVGDAPYYSRHGFAPVPAGQLLLPGPYDPRRLLYRELRAGALENARGLLLAPWRYASLQRKS